jgi:hypothetical protein
MKLSSKGLRWPRPVAAPFQRCPKPRRIFEVDGGYVVPCGAASGQTVARRLAVEWPGVHITLVLQAPKLAGDALLEDLASRAAHACSRIVIYEPKASGRGKLGERAGLFARAVRSCTRVDCGVILDSSRALRHCIEGMATGAIVVYCCDLRVNAVQILEEYGAAPVAQITRARRTEPCVAPAAAVSAHTRTGFVVRAPLGGGI